MLAALDAAKTDPSADVRRLVCQVYYIYLYICIYIYIYVFVYTYIYINLPPPPKKKNISIYMYIYKWGGCSLHVMLLSRTRRPKYGGWFVRYIYTSLSLFLSLSLSLSIYIYIYIYIYLYTSISISLSMYMLGGLLAALDAAKTDPSAEVRRLVCEVYI